MVCQPKFFNVEKRIRNFSQDLDADEWCEGLTAAAPYCFQGSHAFEVGKADTHCKRENANGVDDDLGAGEKIFEFDDVDDDDEDKE